MKAKERAKKVDEAIRLVYDSLESHLPYTYEKDHGASMQFHKKCVKEYARVIQLLSDLY